eukprot:10188323-Alexandrium_andersonii.AAC.1
MVRSALLAGERGAWLPRRAAAQPGLMGLRVGYRAPGILVSMSLACATRLRTQHGRLGPRDRCTRTAHEGGSCQRHAVHC